jgi:hypothetical protein
LFSIILENIEGAIRKDNPRITFTEREVDIKEENGLVYGV